MTNRENYLAIARRQGYEYMPVHFNMCPSLQEKFRQYQETHDLFIPEGPSLEAKEQALITNALVTESLHPVNIPMAKAHAVKAAVASLFLTFNAFSA